MTGDLPEGIGRPAQRALAAAGYDRLDQLTRVSEAELLKLHGVGPKALGLLRSALAGLHGDLLYPPPRRRFEPGERITPSSKSLF